MERDQKRDGRAAKAVASGVGFPGGDQVCLSALRAALRGSRHNRQGVAALGLLAASHRFAGAGAAALTHLKRRRTKLFDERDADSNLHCNETNK